MPPSPPPTLIPPSDAGEGISDLPASSGCTREFGSRPGFWSLNGALHHPRGKFVWRNLGQSAANATGNRLVWVLV